jgi:predicted lipid-binding transport protein (Tim44 family)
MRKAPIGLALALALAAGGANAQLFKCVKDGRTVYQDSPCDDAARQSTVRAPAPGPVAAPPAARDAKGAQAPTAAPAPAAGANAIDMVASYTICAERVPNFERKYSGAYAAWKGRNAAAIDRLANEPDASQLDTRLREERARPKTESLAERCADVATTLQPPREAGLPKVVQ